jgi:two-component system sensor histidine kinase RegB
VVLDNLVRNARAAAPDGPVQLTVRRDGDAGVAEVRNPGELPAELLADDADRPLAASAHGLGLGLGLFISRQLVRNAGGSLRLRQDGGTVVAELRLPAGGAA